MKKKLKYWDNFYKKKKLTLEPSKFAIFCRKILKNYKGTLYDIGCGNGRDSIYFNKNKIHCFGIDKSKEAIKRNKKNFIRYKNKFLQDNFCRIFFKSKINENFSIYSRFTLHAINYLDENRLISSIKKQSNINFLFIECRTLKDEYYGVGKKVGKHEFISSHYRRFIDPQVLKNKLSKNFKIIYFKQSYNFAKFKKENPCILRIVAKKR